MTEPPEPRRPEEGGGEEDYDKAWDNADIDEVLGGLEDDVLLDSIAQGVRGELGPDELTELLSGLRDVPDSTDIPVPNTARVERGENVLPPRTPQEGSSSSMSISDAVNGMNQIAGDTSAAGPLYDAKNGLEISTTNALQQSVTAVSQLNSMGLGALEGAPEAGSEFGAAAEQAAGRIEEAIDAVQAALTAVGVAIEAEQMFRVKAQHIADRLSAL